MRIILDSEVLNDNDLMMLKGFDLIVLLSLKVAGGEADSISEFMSALGIKKTYNYVVEHLYRLSNLDLIKLERTNGKTKIKLTDKGDKFINIE